MDTSTHVDTQTHRIHSCKKKKKEKERNNTCRVEILSQTNNSA